MISEKTFETIERACRVKCPNKLFGGLQVIFVGDFYQLSPVVNNLYGDNGNFCFQSPFFKKVFQHTVGLTKNNRQADEKLIKVITEVRAILLIKRKNSSVIYCAHCRISHVL